MKLAEKFKRPLISFVDTPGAYPGIDAEERGQAEAIAFNLREMAKLKIPTIVVILGEGGSGGALAIGIGDRVLMMENSIYSVITPEGCAAILWKDAAESERAANGLRLTARDLKQLGVIDGIISEKTEWLKVEGEELSDPITANLKAVLIKHLGELKTMTVKQRLDARYEKFRNMGKWITSD
jgi:acetyl-CoA carboxylase carboxyl transferase subunit alpha